MTRRRAFGAGLLAGLTAALLMTTTMLLLAWLFGVATPLVLLGDRLSVFIPADTFLALMGRVGGYNNMKQLGVGSVVAGQLAVGALGGIIYGVVKSRRPPNRFGGTALVFIFFPPTAGCGLFLPFLGTHYLRASVNTGRV